MTDKWITQKQFKEELTNEYGQDISYQRIRNWIERGQVKTKTVYGSLVLVDKTSLTIDLEKEK